MPTTSRVEIRTVVKGSDEGVSLQGEFVQVNTTGTRVSLETTFNSGVSSATSFTSPPNAKWVTISMPSDNTEAWRLTASTAEVGLPMSAQGASVLSIGSTSTAGQTFYSYTTGTTAIRGVRIVFS